MELLLRASLLVLLLAVTSVSPGLLLVRRLPGSPLERLVTAIGASFLALYLVSFVLFWAAAPRAAYVAWSLLCLAALAWLVPDLRRTWRDARCRRVLGAFAVLLCWCLLLLGQVRHYSGARTAGDWIEHAQRMAFFMRELPPGQPLDLHFRFIGLYELPARPPLQNLLAAFYGKQLGRQFEYFSLAFLYLNATAFLPACLLLTRLARRGGRETTLLLALFAVCPFFLQNVSVTWTKLFAGFYVLLGVWFYLRALGRPGRGDLVRTAVAFAAGALVHYSALPYALGVGAHWLLWGRSRRAAVEALGAFGVGAAVLLTWLAWSLAVYGAGGTFLSNTSVTDAARLGAAENALKVVQNAWNTLVPHGLRGESLDWLARRSPESLVRDAAFLTYQTCLLAMPGSAGGLLALWLFVRGVGHGMWRTTREAGFWLVFVVVSFAAGIASHGSPEAFGIGNIVLQPLALIALALLAAGLPGLGRPLRRLAVAGMVVDLVLGVLLHFALQNRTFRVASRPDGGYEVLLDNGLTAFAALNFQAKIELGIRLWGDHLAPVAPALMLLSALGGAGFVIVALRRLERGRDAC